MKHALIIFVRKPELGKVKTRLAAVVGDEKALSIYKKLLAHTLKITEEAGADKYVFYSTEIENEDMWCAKKFSKRLQSDDELGGKMKKAFAELFSEGYEKILIIGSDCFELTTNLIHEAFTLLDKADAVIGPAKDGGYYLLGMKQLLPFLFENKNWSTASVYEQTLADFKERKLSFRALPLLNDVDTVEDLSPEIAKEFL